MTDELATGLAGDGSRVARPADPSDFAIDPENANAGTIRGRYMVGESIERHGGGRSILVDRRGRTIAGAKTLEAAVEAGLDLLVLDTVGDVLVVVRRQDLDLDDPETGARSLAYADNRASEVGLSWDVAQIRADREANPDVLGAWFFADELEGLEGAQAAATTPGVSGSGDDGDGRLDRVLVDLAADQVIPFWTLVRALAAATGRTADEDLARDACLAGFQVFVEAVARLVAEGDGAKVRAALGEAGAGLADQARRFPGL